MCTRSLSSRGDTIECVPIFDTTGQLVVGCHEPGRWEAG